MRRKLALVYDVHCCWEESWRAELKDGRVGEAAWCILDGASSQTKGSQVEDHEQQTMSQRPWVA